MALPIMTPPGTSHRARFPQAAAEALSSYSRSQAFYGSNFIHSTLELAEDQAWGVPEGEADLERDADEWAPEEAMLDEEWDAHEPQSAGIVAETIGEDEVFTPSTYASTASRVPFRMPGMEDLTPIAVVPPQQQGDTYFRTPERPSAVSVSVTPSPPRAPPQPPTTEQTPLLRRTQSATLGQLLQPPPVTPPSHRARRASQPAARLRAARLSSATYSTLTRRPSMRGPRAEWGVLKHQYEAPITEAPGLGTSTFGQSLFNTIAVLLGIGVLSESVAFAYAGWVGGFVLLFGYGLLTCYTAKILARIMALDARISSYADISRAAFGPRSIWLTNAMFCLELFTLAVVLVILFSDTMHEIVPEISSDMWKLIGLGVTLPTVFLPLNLLAFTSILGVLSILVLVATVLIDGFTLTSSPGSLLSPAPTSFLPDWPRLPIAFGLIMSSFSGHTIIPSIAKDMKQPERFDTMITLAFAVATVLYGVIASAGYLMFGNEVSDEVSKDLVNTPGYNPALNLVMAIGLVINPLSKYALVTRPLSNTLETMVGMRGPTGLDPHAPSPGTPPKSHPFFSRHSIFLFLSRTSLSLVVVLTAILIPSFSMIMSFLGAFSAFLLCVIGPIAAKCAVEGRWGWADLVILAVSAVMAIAGTAAGFTA